VRTASSSTLLASTGDQLSSGRSNSLIRTEASDGARVSAQSRRASLRCAAAHRATRKKCQRAARRRVRAGAAMGESESNCAPTGLRARSEGARGFGLSFLAGARSQICAPSLSLALALALALARLRAPRASGEPRAAARRRARSLLSPPRRAQPCTW
jgi:hypothetical protein